MTTPAPETIEREKDKVWVTDAELARRLGVPWKTLRPVIEDLEKKTGFPRKQKLWGNRRYMPGVMKFLDQIYGPPTIPPQPVRRESNVR